MTVIKNLGRHKKEEEVVGVVVGMEYLVSLADVGMQVFLFFRTRSRWGWNILCTFRMWGWNLWGLKRRRRRRRRRRGTI
jgi:hypothetical protein